MKFGERMKRVREEKNLTLEEMARVIGAAQFFVTDTVTSPDTAKETVAVADCDICKTLGPCELIDGQCLCDDCYDDYQAQLEEIAIK